MSKNGVAAPASQNAIRTVVDAWDMAVQAAKDGASNARATAGNMVPAAGRFVSRAVYTMSYSLSYGFVFPAAFIAKSMPADNAVMHGLVDGARAANDWVDELKHREPAAEEEGEAEAPARAKRGRPRAGATTSKSRTKRKSGR
jgi:hypothetical protein